MLRIEDTDQERYVEGATEIIYRTLEKTGLVHDEGPDKDGGYGPYVQSERMKTGIYMKYAKELIDKGEAYYCFCDKERLASLKTEVVDGKEMTSLPPAQLRQARKKIGMIFQDCGASLSPTRTIGEQIIESMAAHRKVDVAEAKRAALELFEKLHFQDGERIWDSYPFELSGGMNQRAGIAIAMLMNPAVLLADEPTSALDMAVQRQVVEEMLHVREAFGTAIIIVTHDIGVVSAMADSIVVLSNGCVMEYAAAKDVLENPQNDYTVKLLSAVPRLRREKA